MLSLKNVLLNRCYCFIGDSLLFEYARVVDYSIVRTPPNTCSIYWEYLDESKFDTINDRFRPREGLGQRAVLELVFNRGTYEKLNNIR